MTTLALLLFVLVSVLFIIEKLPFPLLPWWHNIDNIGVIVVRIGIGVVIARSVQANLCNAKSAIYIEMLHFEKKVSKYIAFLLVNLYFSLPG